MKKIISVLAVFMVMMAFSTGAQAQNKTAYYFASVLQLDKKVLIVSDTKKITLEREYFSYTAGDLMYWVRYSYTKYLDGEYGTEYSYASGALLSSSVSNKRSEVEDERSKIMSRSRRDGYRIIKDSGFVYYED